jgi:CelD/BcsL family acetyltransferase involved in cellulose biosynthesis
MTSTAPEGPGTKDYARTGTNLSSLAHGPSGKIGLSQPAPPQHLADNEGSGGSRNKISMAANPNLSLELIDARADRDRVRQLWQVLTAEGAPSYFLSWSWLENWLELLPAQFDVQMACFRQAGAPVLGCLLVRAPFSRQGIFRGRRLAIHETGNWEYDSLYVEYNGFVGRPNAAQTVAPLLWSLPRPWHEIEFSGLDAQAFPGQQLLQESGPFEVSVTQERQAHYIDLAAVRAKKDYLSLLSSNTRSQIRRSERMYAEMHGAVTVEVARDLTEARAFYDEMLDLHRRSWELRGQESHFLRPWIQAFHQRLIVERFPSGEIQMVRVRAGEYTIGCLYNFIHAGRVYFYQGGLVHEYDNKLKPGMVSHAAAIQHCAGLGLAEYDFLAGVEQYKERMGTDHRTLAWARVQRPLLRFKAEKFARRVAKDALARWEEWKKQRQSRMQTAQPQEASS